MRRCGYYGYGGGLEPETDRYLALPGVSLTAAQIASIDANIRAIKYGTGLTLLVLTGNLSTVAGTQFSTGFSTDLRLFSTDVWGSQLLTLSFSDGTNTWAATNGAKGTGETFSAEKITSWTNFATPYETFTPNANGHDIDSAINTVDSGFGYTNDGGFATGKLYYLSTNLTINSGQAPHIFNGSLGGSAGTEFDKNPLTAGAYTKYATSKDNSHPYFWTSNDAAANYSLLCSWKQVLTPDALGIVLSGGSGASFNPNAATKNLTVTRQ